MNPDFLDLLRELCAAEARFLVVGAYAVGIHGHPRATKDLDVWVEPSKENAPKVLSALRQFGAPLHGLTQEDLEHPGIGLQIGVEPGRIDILTEISDVVFADAWPSRMETCFGEEVRCGVLGIRDLLRNKRASGRLQDLADVEALERLLRLKGELEDAK